MNPRRSIIVATVVLLSSWVGAGPLRHIGHVPGEVVVQYRLDDLARPQADAKLSTQDLALRTRRASLRALDEKYRLVRSRPLLDATTQDRLRQRINDRSLLSRGMGILPMTVHEQKVRATQLSTQDSALRTLERLNALAVLTFDTTAPIEAICAAYRADPNVLAAEPNWVGTLFAAPTDPLYPQQRPDLSRIGIETAWGVQTGSSSVTVAVIDSGVDGNHLDLNDVLAPDGYDFVKGSATISDDLGHGTRVAGIIGAQGNNGEGIAGVAYGVRLLALDVADSSGAITSARAIAAVNYAVAHGADVINMSFGFYAKSSLLEQACQNAYQAGVILVASVGNENQCTALVYPAAFDSVIGVAASDSDNPGAERAVFSNYNSPGLQLADLAAPGATILSTIPGSIYDGTMGSGTSYASPMVAGVAALLKSRYPTQSAAGLRYHLLATADPIGEWAGSGHLNAGRALLVAPAPRFSIVSIRVDDATSYSATNDGDGRFEPAEMIRLHVALRNNGADAVAVWASLSTTDTVVTIPDRWATWGNMPAGAERENTADAFTSISLPLGVTSHDAPMRLAVSSLGTPTQMLVFALPIENTETPPAIIGTNTTWRSEKTYRITRNTVVMDAAKLTIEPGTTIRFTPTGRLEVRGAIDARGTAEHEILFTTLDDYPGGGIDPLVYRFYPGTSPTGNCVAIGDADNDGLNEIVQTGQSGPDTGDISLYRWNGSAFLRTRYIANGAGLEPVQVIVADVDSDRDNDIVVAQTPEDANHNLFNEVAVRSWNRALSQFPGFGGIWLRSSTRSALFEHCNVRFGPVLDESHAASFSDCLFEASGSTASLSTTLGTTPVLRCEAIHNNAGHGIVAGAKTLIGCVAVGNALKGLVGGSMDGCRADGNGDSGIDTTGHTTGTVTNCSAANNGYCGILASGDVLQSLAVGNRYGIAGQNVTSSTAERNRETGISSFGIAIGCRATDNGGIGLSGRNLINCVVADNGSGLSVSGTISGCYVGYNAGIGATGGTITGSTIYGNEQGGVKWPVRLENSWVICNEGIGIVGRPKPYYSPITSCTIIWNTDSEIKNSGAIHGCNIFDYDRAIGYDYEESRPSTELQQVDLTRNYWGPKTTALMNAHPWGTYFNIPTIYDFVDDTNLCEARYAGHLQQAASVPDSQPPAFLLTALPDLQEPVGVGETRFSLTFSKPMDTAIQPAVTFGTTSPYTQNVVAPDPGWVASTTWQGKFAISVETGDWLNKIRVSQATDVTGFVIPDDTVHEFVIDSGKLGANVGLATAIGSNALRCSWDPSTRPNLQGYNLLRSRSGLPGTYVKVNSSLLTTMQYVNSGLQPATTYYYIVYQVDDSLNSTQLTPPFMGATLPRFGTPVLFDEPQYTPGTLNELSWSPLLDAVGYYVEYDDTPTFSSPLNSDWIAQTRWTATGLADGMTYYYRVKCRNAAMTQSGWSNKVSSTQDASPPTAPGTPKDTGAITSSTSVRFTWTAATDGGSGMGSYDLQVGTSPGGSNVFNANVGNVLSRTVAASHGQTLYARVRARDKAGNIGSWSGNSDGITVHSAGPRLVRVLSNDQRTLTVTFDEPATNANQPSNYSCTGGISILGAVRLTSTQYRLATSDQKWGGLYTLTAKSAIKDSLGNPVDPYYCSRPFYGGGFTAVTRWPSYR